MPLTDEQTRALQLVVDSNHRLVVLTGGPGVGKTFTLRAILDAAEERGWDVAQASPTGKAAKRMNEMTGRPARTLHRLLEYSQRLGGFARGAGHPLEADLVVVDEASMLDIELFTALLKAIPAAGRLLLVGDVDQLPSVGPGAVLRDLVASGVVPVARLTKVMRQSERSWIHLNAQAINRGEMPMIDNARSDDFLWIEEDEAAEIPGRISRLLAETFHKRFPTNPVTGAPYHPLRDFQVLTPMHKGPAGVASLNEALRFALNPEGCEVRYGDKLFRVGDRVIQTMNDYDLEVFNGESGSVADAFNGVVDVDYGDRITRYSGGQLQHLEPAYAITTHKSQGSEFPVVVVVAHTTNYIMLARQLLYTAITRARQVVFVIGNEAGLKRSVENADAGQRYTRLGAYLQAGKAGRGEEDVA